MWLPFCSASMRLSPALFLYCTHQRQAIGMIILIPQGLLYASSQGPCIVHNSLYLLPRLMEACKSNYFEDSRWMTVIIQADEWTSPWGYCTTMMQTLENLNQLAWNKLELIESMNQLLLLLQKRSKITKKKFQKDASFQAKNVNNAKCFYSRLLFSLQFPLNKMKFTSFSSYSPYKYCGTKRKLIPFPICLLVFDRNSFASNKKNTFENLIKFSSDAFIPPLGDVETNELFDFLSFRMGTFGKFAFSIDRFVVICVEVSWFIDVCVGVCFWCIDEYDGFSREACDETVSLNFHRMWLHKDFNWKPTDSLVIFRAILIAMWKWNPSINHNK